MPGLVCSRMEFSGNGIDIDNLFGFYYCDIECHNGYLGLLSVRVKNGVHFPLGKWSGWYFSEELKFAKANGYNISVVKGYSLYRVSDDVLKNYVENVYKIKSNPRNDTEKSIAKSLLNNLLGRFGIDISKPRSDIVSESKFGTLCTMHKIHNHQDIGDDNVLISYSPALDPKTIYSFNLSLERLSDKYGDRENIGQDGISVVISAAVNAYARIHIS